MMTILRFSLFILLSSCASWMKVCDKYKDKKEREACIQNTREEEETRNLAIKKMVGEK